MNYYDPGEMLLRQGFDWEEPNLAQVVGFNPNAQYWAYPTALDFSAGYDPNALSDAQYWAYANAMARPQETPQYWTPPAPRPVPQRVPQQVPQVPQTAPLEEAPYPPPEYMLPPFIRPPQNWAPEAALPYPYYGV